MPWAGGVYTRGYPSWSSDAASNLPISATKFDTEDNDFATGLNNCLTKDGLNTPSSTLNWSQTASAVANFSRGSDGTIFTLSRTGGSNNPALQIINADATGMSLNLTTAAQQLSLAIAGTAVLALAAATATLNPSTSGTLGLGAVPVIAWASGAINFFNNVIAGTATASLTNTSTVATQDGRVNISAGSSTLSLYSANQNRASAVLTGGPTTAQGALFTASAIPLVFGTNGIYAGQISSAGAWTIPAPTAGTALAISGFANSSTVTIIGSATSGQGFGLLITAGSTTVDYALNVKNQTAATTYLQVQGNGETFVLQPPAGSAGPANCFQVGYLETPLNTQAGAYTLVMTDRGKLIQQTAVAGIIIPANASVAFPIGATILLYNNSGSPISISITTDTLTFLPSNLTGSRTLAANSIMTLWKIAATSWRCWGFGIT